MAMHSRIVVITFQYFGTPKLCVDNVKRLVVLNICHINYKYNIIKYWDILYTVSRTKVLGTVFILGTSGVKVPPQKKFPNPPPNFFYRA